MALNKAVKGARRTGQRITWTRDDRAKTPVDLTGATITARIKNVETGQVIASDGTFTVLTTAKMNEFTWAYGESDVGSVGRFEVQFTATYTDQKRETTYPEPWEVVDAF